MIVFISTYLSIHQLPFCDAMDALTNHSFRYIATSPIRKERLQNGYVDLDRLRQYVIRAYESKASSDAARALCNECDVLLVGSAPRSFYLSRLRKKQLTFLMWERPFKERPAFWNRIRRAGGIMRSLLPYQNRNLFMLAIGAYTANDYLRCGCFRNRIYKWGYFPPVKIYGDSGIPADGRIPDRIIWVGRFVDVKHPENAVLLAERLMKERVPFTMEMIGGDSPLRTEIARLTEAAGLSGCVMLSGALPSEDVRSKMEQSAIFLFTSDRGEGWGAVVNEAMNSGCAVVACRSAGSVPFLVRDGENGFTFNDGNLDTAFEKLKRLLSDSTLRASFGSAAYETVRDCWNADEAAKRLLYVIDSIRENNKKPFFYDSGICSAAKIIRKKR